MKRVNQLVSVRWMSLDLSDSVSEEASDLISELLWGSNQNEAFDSQWFTMFDTLCRLDDLIEDLVYEE